MSRRKQQNPKALKKNDDDPDPLTPAEGQIDRDADDSIASLSNSVASNESEPVTQLMTSLSPDQFDSNVISHGVVDLKVDDVKSDLVYVGSQDIPRKRDTVSCGICNGRFQDVSSLQKHTLQNHSVHDLGMNQSPDPVYGCKVCGQEFESILSLHKHVNNVHDGKDYASPDSPARSTPVRPQSKQPSQLMLHPFCCDHCPLSFEKRTFLESHVMMHFIQKDSQYVCQSCTKSFILPEELQKHLIDIHALQLFKCALCREIFQSKVEIQVHFAVSHSQEVIIYRCNACPISFEALEDFENHVRVNHVNKRVSDPSVLNMLSHSSHPFACQICGEAFNVEFFYDQHMTAVHGVRVPQQTVFAPPNEADAYNFYSIPKSGNSGIRGDIFINVAAHSIGGSVKCNICDLKCETTVELSQHKLQHCKVIKSDRCSVCREVFTNLDSFYAHVRKHNHHGLPITCVVCKQSLAAASEVEIHGKFHLVDVISRQLSSNNQNEDNLSIASQSEYHTEQNDSIFRCGVCNCKFENITEYERHQHGEMKTEASTSKCFQCLKCQESFESESEIRDHVTSHVLKDGIEHICKLCHQVFDSPSKLQSHLIGHAFEGYNQFPCYLCGLVFTTVPLLHQHMMKLHGLEDRIFECTSHDCKQKFFFRTELENHILTGHEYMEPEPTFPVNCDHIMPNVSYPIAAAKKNPYLIQNVSGYESIPQKKMKLQENVETKNAGGLQRPAVAFVCPGCQRTHSTDEILREHFVHCLKYQKRFGGTPGPMPIYHSAPECSTSSSRFSSTSSLVKMLADHHTNVVFPCPHCMKVFNSLSALQGHSHVHMVTNKTHKCKICDKVYATAAKLRNHQRQHNGDKPFLCDICSKPFSRKDNLKVHLKTHFKNGHFNASPESVQFDLTNDDSSNEGDNSVTDGMEREYNASRSSRDESAFDIMLGNISHDVDYSVSYSLNDFLEKVVPSTAK